MFADPPDGGWGKHVRTERELPSKFHSLADRL
jgi:hypothetical protein